MTNIAPSHPNPQVMYVNDHVRVREGGDRQGREQRRDGNGSRRARHILQPHHCPPMDPCRLGEKRGFLKKKTPQAGLCIQVTAAGDGDSDGGWACYGVPFFFFFLIFFLFKENKTRSLDLYE